MKSVILTALWSFLIKFFTLFSQSGTYRLFNKLFGVFSRGWQNSSIVGFLKKDSGTKSGESFFYRVCYLPFFALNYLNRKFSRLLSMSIRKSIFVSYCKIYLHNCLALNTRFLGFWMIAAFIGRSVMFFNAGFSKFALALGAAGVILSIKNYNITAFLDGSIFVKFIKHAVGFPALSFDFFDERQTTKRIRLFMALILGFVCGIVMSQNALYAFAVPVAIGGVFAVFMNPLVGVFTGVIIAPFAPTMALAGVCLLTMASLIIKAVSTKGFRWKMDGVGMGLIVLLVILFVSSLFSFSPVSSLTVWAMYFVFVSFYFVITNTVNNKKLLYSLIRVMVLFGALVALYGIMQYVFGWTTSNAWIDEEMFEDSTMRVYSTMGNPNVLGEYLLLTLPLAAVFMIKEPWNRLSKYVYIAIFAVMAVCLVLTQSRGCWLGFLLCTAVFVTFWKGRLWGLMPIAFAALIFLLPQTMIDRVLSIGNMEDTSTSYRVFIWMGTLDMMKDFWIGGIGMGEGAFKSVYPLYSYNAIVAPHSHNTFLQLLVEGGIACVGTFIVTMVLFIKKLARAFSQNAKNSRIAIMALAIASGTLGFLLQSMFDYTFYNYRMMAMFFMFVAFGTCLYTTRRPQ